MDENKVRQKGKSKILVYSLIITVILYAFLLYIEKAILSREEYVSVVVVTKDLIEDFYITEKNAGEYFTIQERVAKTIPEGYVSDISELYGTLTNRAYVAKDIITKSGVDKEVSRYANIEYPIEVSISVSELSQAVGGTLRQGDYINIWNVSSKTINGVTKVTPTIIREKAYVSKTFTTSGVEVTRGQTASGETSPTMVINIIIDRRDEEEFNAALVNGTIRISKYLNNVELEYEKSTSSEEATVEEVTTESPEVLTNLYEDKSLTAKEREYWESIDRSELTYLLENGDLLIGDLFQAEDYIQGEYLVIDSYRYEYYYTVAGELVVPDSINYRLME